MRGRDFLELAREIVTGADDVHWRGAAGRAYYALMLECREALFRWGFALPPRENVHTFVRFRFSFAADSDLKAIGWELDIGVRLRNQADYKIGPTPEFASAGQARKLILAVQSAIDLLDAIDADATRKADAIKAIRAAFP